MNRGNYYKQKYGNKRKWNSAEQEQKQTHPHGSQPRTPNDFVQHLTRLNNKSYGSYKQLLDHTYAFPQYTLLFEKVQSDPFAPPSQLRIRVDKNVAGFPEELYNTRDRCVALADFLARNIAHYIGHLKLDAKMTGSFAALKGGNLEIAVPSQKILERTSVIVCTGYVEVRLLYGLTAHGRTITSEPVITMFSEMVPRLIHRAIEYSSQSPRLIQSHLECYEDQQWLRKQLSSHDLIAFVPNGAILPRESGVSDRPLAASNRVAFQAPSSLQVSFNCPSGKVVTGMGVRRGITMIAGGGYHGKSTLLEALEQGIYNHIPGDGREYLVSNETLTKVRSEDGRSIEGTDVSPFIDNLPFAMDTKRFHTQDASGSTSMAAGIQEMVEMGVEVLVYDEDTCATNFMIRDQRMQLIIDKSREPITPLISKIRPLHTEKHVSSVLVIGGSGDYIDVADYIIEMRNYIPIDITDFAKGIALQYPSNAHQEGGNVYGDVAQRKIKIPEYVSSGKTKVFEKNKISFNEQELDLSSMTNIAEKGQTQWIASAISYLYHEGNTVSHSLKDALVFLGQKLDAENPMPDAKSMIQSPMDFIAPSRINGGYTRPSIIQIAQAINRLRNIRRVN